MRELGELLGCSHQAIFRWERGACWPQARYRRRLEALMGASLDELLAPDSESKSDADSKADAAEEGPPAEMTATATYRKTPTTGVST